MNGWPGSARSTASRPPRGRGRLRGPRRVGARVGLDLGFELVVGEGQHPAVGVVDQHDLAGAEQALGDGERADLVVGDDSAGVADDVRVALVRPSRP